MSKTIPLIAAKQPVCAIITALDIRWKLQASRELLKLVLEWVRMDAHWIVMYSKRVVARFWMKLLAKGYCVQVFKLQRTGQGNQSKV
jgi:hypothetical protein